MKIKHVLWILFTLTLPVLMGCQMLKNRKPQSAGSTAYCSNCLVEKIDKDIDKLRKTIQESNPKLVKYPAVKTPVPVRFATVFNKDGKPICRVNLLKYPALMPNFAKPVEQMVYQANESKRGLASTEEGSELPPCTDKYLHLLTTVAKNNVVLNSDKPPIHKAGLKENVVAGVAGCILGSVTSLATDIDTKIGVISSTFAGSGFLGVALGNSAEERLTIQELEKKRPWINRNKQNKLKEQISKLKKNRPVHSAMAGASFCYLGAEVVAYTK